MNAFSIRVCLSMSLVSAGPTAAAVRDATESAIQNRLFGAGFLPGSVEVKSWTIDAPDEAAIVSLPVFICHHEDKHRTYLSVHPDKASAEEQAIDYVIHEAEARGVDLGTIDQDADPIAAFQDVTNGEGFLGIEETTLNLPPNYAAAPDMLATLREALDAYKGAFEDEDVVNGGDLVEWFAMWRETAKAAVAKAEGRSNG
jgi:hypothetical protein